MSSSLQALPENRGVAHIRDRRTHHQGRQSEIAWQARLLDSGRGNALSSTTPVPGILLTVIACHCPPRAVAMPRALSASATSQRVRAPARHTSRIQAHQGSVLHAHDLRRTAATKFYIAGLPIRVIAEFSAWSEEQVDRTILTASEMLKAAIAAPVAVPSPLAGEGYSVFQRHGMGEGFRQAMRCRRGLCWNSAWRDLR
jgi:integrase